jgi:hypothetical protein
MFVNSFKEALLQFRFRSHFWVLNIGRCLEEGRRKRTSGRPGQA